MGIKNNMAFTENSFYKNVIESLEDYCVFTTDMHGYITSWNSGAQNIMGYGEEEIIGELSDKFFIEEDRYPESQAENYKLLWKKEER